MMPDVPGGPILSYRGGCGSFFFGRQPTPSGGDEQFIFKCFLV